MSKPFSPLSTPPPVPSNRRTHRKRVSALRLSSDTTSTLPEYVPTGGWSQTTTTTTTTTTTSGPTIDPTSSTRFGLHSAAPETPLDLPPDYPDSAEEADEDTDSEDSAYDARQHGHHRQNRQQQQEYVPQFTTLGGVSGTMSPRKNRRFPSHRSARSVGSSSTGLKSPLQSSTRSSPVPSPTASDVFLDSLLERSVHALEMSNALLQSSMTTRSTLSNIIAAGGSDDSEPSSPPKSKSVMLIQQHSHRDQQKHVRRRSEAIRTSRYDALESRLEGWKSVQDTWADDLDEIKKGVERLFGGETGESVDDTEIEVGPYSASQRRREYGHAHRSEASISSSMPVESPLKQRMFISTSNHRHEGSSCSASFESPSGEPEDVTTPQTPSLRFEAQQRANLVSHPPRAMTQYVSANSEIDTIILPSTLGLRSTASRHRVVDPASNNPDIPAKAAYNMLSSLAASSTPSSSSSTFIGSIKSRRRSFGQGETATAEREEPSRSSRTKSASPTRSRSWVGVMGRSRSESQNPTVGGGSSFSSRSSRPRTMTPPIEGLSSSGTSSTSESSDEDPTTENGKKRGPSAKQTVQELRRILKESPKPPPSSYQEPRLKPPMSMLVQKSTTAEAGTSNATASVSRLLTKNKHSSSTRAASPPRQSALKGRSMPGTPTTPVEPPTSAAIHAAVQAAQVTAAARTQSDLTRSASGSAFRVPWMISAFAKSAMLGKGKGKAKEDDSNWKTTSMGSTPGSGASTPKRISFAELPEPHRSGNSRLRSRRSQHGRKRSLSDSDERDEGWLGWLVGTSTMRQDRMEDRFDRPWGSSTSAGRMGYGSGLDDWAV